MHEVGSHTFHGREAGYTYHVPYGDKTIHQAYGSTRDYADSKKFAPIHDFYVEPVMHQHDYDVDRSPTEGVATYDADHGHVKLIQEHDDRFAAFLQ